MNIKGQEGKLHKSYVVYLHADRMEFVKLTTSTVYTQQNWHNMVDEIVLNTIIIKKLLTAKHCNMKQTTKKT